LLAQLFLALFRFDQRSTVSPLGHVMAALPLT
jgi:hypothetical protein